MLPFYVANNELKGVLYWYIINMGIKDELREIDIKNPTCYYFDDVKRVRDIDFSDVLLEENFIQIFYWCKTIAYLAQKIRWHY